MPAASGVFDDIKAASRGAVGVTREAFGERETRAAELVQVFARAHGLETGYDHVGNLEVVLRGNNASAAEVVIASHLDSVPLGGNYDGLAGVVAGVDAAAACKRAGITPARTFRTIGFRGEESPWFGTAYLGSKLRLGELTRADLERLKRSDTGRSLADHLLELGRCPDDREIADKRLRPEQVAAYLELHIEQGPLLEAIDCPVGLATAVRGNIRHPFAMCRGVYAHSAAVPRHLRSDAVIATAKLVAFMDERWREEIAAGNNDLVFTCGVFHTDATQHVMTKVPGEVTFTINIGGTSDAVMEAVHAAMTGKAAELQREHRVEFAFGPRIGTPAVALSSALIEQGIAAANELGIRVHCMPTVGHDAAMFARRGVPASVILVRNAKGSHNPDEEMAIADFSLGTQVLAVSALRV